VTAAPPVPAPPVPASRAPIGAAARLLRLELRRNAMMWMLPWTVALFWLLTYRTVGTLPPMWNVRTMAMQSGAFAVFVPTVIGAAAWMGSRESRLGVTDLLTGTARPRWTRQLATWAATTGWAMMAYLACAGVLYVIIGRQAAWGGPLWWPVLVCAACLPALCALGFAAGALCPSRFTAPLAAIGVFVVLELSLQLIHGDRSHLVVLPAVAGPWQLGPDEGVATFFRYLPDLPLVQVTFLAGLTGIFLGIVGLPAGSGGPVVRRTAAVLAAAGVLLTGAAVTLAGTGRLDAHGMIAIPALHRAADDRPVAYTPVCSRTAIPICLHPAYTSYLSAVTDALGPVLDDVAGLPGAPVRLSQAPAVYQAEEGNGVVITLAGPRVSGTPPILHFLLPGQQDGPTPSTSEWAAAVRRDLGRAVAAAVVGENPGPARDAVAAGLLNTVQPGTDPAVEAAARRFAALPAAIRHRWLADHLATLRAGRLTLAQLP
jgi:hypothetical protein